MLLTVGRIIRAHGVRGEVLVEVLTDEPELRYAAGTVLHAEPAAKAPAPTAKAPIPSELTIESLRPHQGRLIVSFEGVADRTAAEALRGVLLLVNSATVPAPSDPDEYHDHQLIGLTAVTPVGEPLGEITGINHAPAADLLLLTRPDGRTTLVPFVKAIVPQVELAAGRIVVDAPPGLLDL